MERFKVNIYVETNIKPPRRHDAKAMWLVEYVTHGQTFTRQGIIEQKQTTINQLTLTALIEALNILVKPCEIRINTQAESVCNTLGNSWHIQWQKNGWKNAKGNTVQNADLWEKVTDLMANHVCTFLCEDHPFRMVMQRELKKTA